MKISPNKYALVVAHPTDELIWASSVLSRLTDHPLTVILATTPIKDPDRVNGFVNVCWHYGLNTKSTTLKDYGKDVPLQGLELVLDLKEYDRIITHNNVGEYGHLHHKQVHDFVVENYSDKKLTFFGHGIDNPTQTFKLFDSEVDRKINALKFYNHRYKNKPYYESIFNFLNNLSGYDMSIETFVGETL